MRAFMKAIMKICAGAVLIGILLVIAGVASGAANEIDWRKDLINHDTEEIHEDYEGITAVDISLKYGEVHIKTGDKFRIEGYNLFKDSFESNVVDGIWKIKDNAIITDNRWSFTLRPLNLGFSNSYTPNITIYLPEGFEADSFYLQMDAGSVTIDSLISKHKTNIGVGAGEIIVKNMDINNANVTCKAGYIKMNGNATGNVKVDCNVGKVEFNLDGKEEDYNYNINCNLGSVSINNRGYEFSASVNKSSELVDNRLDLICNIGEIVVNTNN